MNGIPLDPPNITSATNVHLLTYDQHESTFLDESMTDPEIQPIRDQFNIDFDSSIKYNAFVAAVSTSKILTTSLLLIIVNLSCFKARETWLVLMLAFDIVYATLHVFKLKTMFSLQNLEPVPVAPAERNNRIQDIVNIPQQVSDNEHEEVNPANGIHIPLVDDNERNMELTKKLERRKRWLSRIILLADALYLGLLVYGQLTYFVYNDDTCDNVPLNYLMLIYIIFGYIWLLLPLGVLVLACFCLPCVMCCYVAFNRSQVPANRTAIKKLPVKKYDEEIMTGSHECSICMVEYKNGDNIIQLGCSPLHYYHEACLKKWLKINGQCPTCRMRLEDMKKD